MKKEAQLVLLPTDKTDGTLWKTTNGQLIHTHVDNEFKQKYQPFHLYILEESKPKEGDYCIEDIGGTVFGPYRNGDVVENPKKIIGTTDPSLVINAVDIREVQGQVMQSHYHKELPQLPQSFIEEYCKNPVEKVMVEYETPVSPLKMRGSNSGKARMLAIKQAAFGLQPRLTSNNELIIHPIEEKLYTREEVAELCAKAYWDGNLNTGDIIPENWIKENL